MLYFTGMTPVEINFIKVYVTALKRHYAEISTVVDIMNPDNLGIKQFYEAACAAQQLTKMHDEFERKMAVVRRKHKIKMIAAAPYPSDEDLADLFSLSFFKLVTGPKDAASKNAKTKQHGWFSGQPEEWQKSVKSYKGVPDAVGDELANLLSQCFNAFAKFLYKSDGKSLDFKYGKKVWPEPPPPDDSAGFLDWFFENEEDDE